MLHISIVAELIGRLGFLPITNSLLAGWVTTLCLVLLAVLATRKLTLVPGRAQSVAELVVGGLYDFFSQITGSHIKKFFPLLASLFLFITAANWIGLLPGVGTIGFYRTEKEEATQQATPVETAVTAEADPHAPADGEASVAQAEAEGGAAADAEGHSETVFVPLLRAATADLNMTIALAIVSVVAMQYFGFAAMGFHYSSRFLNFKSPIDFFLGILELISEVSKIISFAFRLFGNIFAGEVLLAVMAFLMPFIVPLPFLTMELFVGFIQALVFSMLTAVFLSVTMSHGEQHA